MFINFKIYRLGKKLFSAAITCVALSFPASGEEFLSEIYLPEAAKPDYFLNSIQNESFEFEKNYYGKDSVKFNIDNKPNLRGSIELNVKDDKNVLFYGQNQRKFDVNADLSTSLSPFLDLNTDISLTDLDSRSELPSKISNFNLSTDILPYHKLYFGQASLDDPFSGSLAIFDAVEDKYNLGSFRSMEDIDFKLSKQNGFLNYSAGAYNFNKSSSQRSPASTTPITGGYAAINPFYSSTGSGNLQLGGGYFTNRYAVENDLNREDTYSLFTGYRFSRLAIKGEFLRENRGLYDTQISDSWHFSNKFTLTDYLSIKAGFKQYQETDSTESNFGFEYSFKQTPLINSEHLRLELDASVRRGEQWGNTDSERFGIKTKYSF